MKKSVLILVLLALAFSTLGVGTAFAKGQQPPERPARGVMHDYLVAALAEQLNLTVEEVNERLLAGEKLYEIALAVGTREEDLPELLAEVHKQALAAAVADGVISQEWADRMSQRMMGRFQKGGASGTCPTGGTPVLDGSGFQYGVVGGMRGWRGQRANP